MKPRIRSAWVAAWILIVVGFSISHAAAAEVSGTWTFSVDIAGNAGAPTFEFKQDGETLTGTYHGQFGDAELKGTVKDNKIEFSFDLQPGATAIYKGEIDGDTMKGTCDYAGQAEGTWTAKKKAKDEA